VIPGPGGDDPTVANDDCAAGTGTDGPDVLSEDDGGGGGGGGSFGTRGRSGGLGQFADARAAPGEVEGSAQLVPLRGGCAGGRGGRGHPTTDRERWGGAGGGAVQISVSGALTIDTGIVSASGGGGQPGVAEEDGGGGGGSGGAVLLEGAPLVVGAGAWVTANGGGGAEGNSQFSADGSPGADGSADSDAPAPGGSGHNGGDGGQGGSDTSDATAGGPCTLKDGAGGGGGGMGRARRRLVE
jgi:hypothetical protein